METKNTVFIWNKLSLILIHKKCYNKFMPYLGTVFLFGFLHEKSHYMSLILTQINISVYLATGK